uniref:Putative tick transposon n=1 Tax=Ixodes ricinus TaxID=34613 RepID=A0A6B0UQZ9_IXORI
MVCYITKSLMPLLVRRLATHALAYSVLRYGVTAFANCCDFWHEKIDCILKNILKSVSYGMQHPDDTDLFQHLQFPCLRTLFIQTVVLRYFWTEQLKKNRFSSFFSFSRNFRETFRPNKIWTVYTRILRP